MEVLIDTEAHQDTMMEILTGILSTIEFMKEIEVLEHGAIQMDIEVHTEIPIHTTDLTKQEGMGQAVAQQDWA